MESDQKELHDILHQQNELLKANNQLLHKIHRYEMISFWSKVMWFVILIGLPILIYYYFLEPYTSGILETLKNFNETFHQVSGWERFTELYNINSNQ